MEHSLEIKTLRRKNVWYALSFWRCSPPGCQSGSSQPPCHLCSSVPISIGPRGVVTRVSRFSLLMPSVQVCCWWRQWWRRRASKSSGPQGTQRLLQLLWREEEVGELWFQQWQLHHWNSVKWTGKYVIIHGTRWWYHIMYNTFTSKHPDSFLTKTSFPRLNQLCLQIKFQGSVMT